MHAFIKLLMGLLLLLIATIPNYANAILVSEKNIKHLSSALENSNVPVLDEEIILKLEDCPEYDNDWGCSDITEDQITIYIKPTLSQKDQIDTLYYNLGTIFDNVFLDEIYREQFLNITDYNEEDFSEVFATSYMVLAKNPLDKIKKSYCTKKLIKNKKSNKKSKKKIKKSYKTICNYNKLIAYDNIKLAYYQLEDIYEFINDIVYNPQKFKEEENKEATENFEEESEEFEVEVEEE